MKSVYSAVRTGSLNQTDNNFVFKGLYCFRLQDFSVNVDDCVFEGGGGVPGFSL
jgi:hypothetical protein